MKKKNIFLLIVNIVLFLGLYELIGFEQTLIGELAIILTNIQYKN